MSEQLSRREAAERAGVHYNTIRAWEEKGWLTSTRVQVGEREEIRVDADELDKLLEERERPDGPRVEISVERLWERLEEAQQDAQEARQRLARAETELKSCRAELKRERAEREALLETLQERVLRNGRNRRKEGGE